MDLSKFDSLLNSESQLTVLDPEGNPLTYEGPDGPLPVLISLVCCDSPEYVRVHKQQVTEIAERATSRKGKVITGESSERDKLDLLVACTKGWVGFTMNGASFNYSPVNARTLYSRYRFIRDQVDEFIHERGNFLAGNSTN
jgi:hypothetical protein